MSFEIKETSEFKIVQSKSYNTLFNKRTGLFLRWGKTKEEDPDFSPFGPEILDIEISSSNPNDINNNSDRIISTNGGCFGLGCSSFCYKNNKKNKSVHMTLDTFKSILDKLPKKNGIHLTTQIAFGVLSPINQHPQVWDIFQECRNQGIVPNVTINEILTDETAKKLKELCGAVAISINSINKEYAYNSVKKLTDLGMSQINFHIVLSEQNIDFIKQVALDSKSDPRLVKLNAIVMLSFKDKAKTGCFQSIKYDSYKSLLDFLFKYNINIGFDSCSAHLFESYAKDNKKLLECCEPCESGIFSFYINCFGFGYSCSFYENMEEWEHGIDMLSVNNDWWNSERILNWRQRLLNNRRHCPLYQIG